VTFVPKGPRNSTGSGRSTAIGGVRKSSMGDSAGVAGYRGAKCGANQCNKFNCNMRVLRACKFT
jgi:hypothetical protein